MNLDNSVAEYQDNLTSNFTASTARTYSHDRYEIRVGNSFELLQSMDDNSVHSIVTDPPYEIGLMGKAWDKTGIAINSAFWEECLRVLMPGGYLLSFSAAKTYHRIACAIEDAGFEIRDQILWIYGSGFPKSPNLKGEWDGWGTALKPAHEPIVMARKPLIGSLLTNLSAHGVGCLNIDATRVATTDKLGGGRLSGPTKMNLTCGGNEWDRPWMNDSSKREAYAALTATKVKKAESLGRWPANIIHDGTTDAMRAFQINGSENEQDCSKFFYCAKPDKKDKNDGLGDSKNSHPTVKPTKLMRYLCRLVTPKGGVILDPFMGSGSTGRGSLLEGFQFLGFELDPTYAEIANQRIRAIANIETDNT